jgi:hypothetical protein
MESRLPPFTPKEIKLIQGSSDFFGLNHYHTWLIANQDYPDSSPSYHKDKGTKGTQDPDWEPGIVPWGFRKLLNWIKNEYNNPLVIVTENGYGDGGAVDDVNRVDFLKVPSQILSNSCDTALAGIYAGFGGGDPRRLQRQGLHCLERYGQYGVEGRLHVSDPLRLTVE